MGGRTIEIFADLGALSQRAAELFAARCEGAVAERGRFTAVLSGGRTPQTLYAMLAQKAEYRSRIRWRSTHFFWGDERCVPPDHPQSNFRMASSALLSALDLPAENVHRIRAELPGAAGADAYEDELRTFFALSEGQAPRFDFVLLGMGADGHTASLFPGGEAVRERKRLVVAAWDKERSSPRITLTPAAFAGADQVTFLVAGREKAAALAAILEDNADPDQLPASAIQPASGSLIWLVDKAAASRLRGSRPAP